MSVNLDFTEDSQWIEKRKAIWEKIKVSYSSEITKKKREVHYQYFLTGIPPNNYEDMHQFAYIDLFPLQTKEGLEYCFKNLFNPNVGWLNPNWPNSIWYMYSDKRDDVEHEDAIKLFMLFCGDRYFPSKKFPFLIYDETEYRQISIDAYAMLSRFIGSIRSWINSSEENDRRPIQADLIDYMFSIFPYIESHKLYFVVPLPPSTKIADDERGEVKDTINWCKKIHEFLRIFSSEKIVENADSEKDSYINRVQHQLDEMTAPEYPQTLIDHWQWVKEGKKLRNTPPPV